MSYLNSVTLVGFVGADPEPHKMFILSGVRREALVGP
jgi:hypothetical protein